VPRVSRIRAGAVLVSRLNRRAPRRPCEIEAAGGRAVASCGQPKWAAAGRLIQTCIEAFGRIDGLVNNAGPTHLLVEDYDPVGAERSVAVNVNGSLHCTDHAIKTRWARIRARSNRRVGAHLGIGPYGRLRADQGRPASMGYTGPWNWRDRVRRKACAFAATNEDGRRPMAIPEEAGASVRSLCEALENNSFVTEFLLSDLASDVPRQARAATATNIFYSHPALMLLRRCDGRSGLPRMARVFE